MAVGLVHEALPGAAGMSLGREVELLAEVQLIVVTPLLERLVPTYLDDLEHLFLVGFLLVKEGCLLEHHSCEDAP